MRRAQRIAREVLAGAAAAVNAIERCSRRLRARPRPIQRLIAAAVACSPSRVRTPEVIRPHIARIGMQRLFGLLVVAQAAHSIEEYAGWLYGVFAPARAVSAMFSADLERGFVISNALLVAFGVACYLGPVRRRWEIAPLVVWIWILLELVNGIGHPAWSIAAGRYTPGVITALVILPLAVLLAISAQAAKHDPNDVAR